MPSSAGLSHLMISNYREGGTFVMPAMLKYALRYAPLIIVALLLVPLRLYMAAMGQQQTTPLAYQATSPFSPGTALYSVALLPASDVWAVGGSFSFFKPADT